jgi:hypothetical protein
VRVSLRARWLFVQVDVLPRRAARARAPRPPVTGRPRPRRRALGRALATPGLVPRILRLLRGVVQRVHWEDVSVRAQFGLEDPADTGTLYGALVPLLLAVDAHGLDVRCDPVFEGACLQGRAAATARVVPLGILTCAGAFVCSPSVLKAVWTMRGQR